MSQADAELIYIGDPMCSWCYGISEELNEAKETLRDDVSFRMIMGGLRPYNQETMTDLSDFLTHHWEEVAAQSGQPFNFGILNMSDLKYDTEIPSRATIIIREIDPSKEYAFFKEIQSAFYLDNKRTDQVETYLEICEKLGINKKAFSERFDSRAAKDSSMRDFEAARILGVNSFPTLILKKGNRVINIANGYITAENIVSKVRSKIKW